MPTIKKYTLEHEFGAQIDVEVDHDILTPEVLTEFVMFWGDGAEKLAEHGPLHAFLRRFTVAFLVEAITSISPCDSFDRGCVEGYPAVDGSTGLRVLRYDAFDFDDVDVYVRERAAA
ncbi:DUF2528 family protein [Pandoraea commovens]|uniref:Uncharacterized protein n=1 Tax=Pandoraea commovens TaxID=2508289 RepID=A0A5E4S3A5_9BURK|nr:DUF2528 family protein [Pandoraea commovens]VVD68519.1 hypothetical protein PCO31010_00486 [Pandoraea commovens]